MRHSTHVPGMLLILAFSVGLSAQGDTIPARVAIAHANGHAVGKPLDLVFFRNPQPLPLATLAAAEFVAVGTLTKLKTYVSNDKRDIYTDYQLMPKHMIVDSKGAQTRKAPGATHPVIVRVYGGELVVEGTPVRANDKSVITWDESADVLVFLYRSADDPTNNELFGGSAGLFLVESGAQRVKSLLNHWDKDRDVKDKSFDQIVQKIHAVAKK